MQAMGEIEKKYLKVKQYNNLNGKKITNLRQIDTNNNRKISYKIT